MYDIAFDRADAFLLGIIESGQDTLIELYHGELWAFGMNLLDDGTDLGMRWGYFCLLDAVAHTPTLPADEAYDLMLGIITDEMADELRSVMRRKETEAALDAQVAPMLAWLDA